MHTSLAASNTQPALHFPMHGNVARNVTMTSLELVELINSMRAQGEPQLAHRSFMGKVPKVLGEAAAKFFASDTYLNGTGGRVTRDIYRFEKREACLMAMSYSYELQAAVFDHMTKLEEQVRGGGTGSGKIVGELAIAECYARLLKPAPSSQVAMLAKIAKINGLSADFLPAYAIDAPTDADQRSSAPTKALTPLLREHGIDLSAAAFNQLLKAHGVLKRMTRKNSRQQQVEFWSVTEAGLVYGKNITSPNNPRETQPHWYVDRFEQLVKLVGGAV